MTREMWNRIKFLSEDCRQNWTKSCHVKKAVKKYYNFDS